MPAGNRKYTQTKIKTKQASSSQKPANLSGKIISNMSKDNFTIKAMKKQKLEHKA